MFLVRYNALALGAGSWVKPAQMRHHSVKWLLDGCLKKKERNHVTSSETTLKHNGTEALIQKVEKYTGIHSPEEKRDLKRNQWKPGYFT